MATAVSDRSNHAAPDHFRDRAKPGGITGQSPLISVSQLFMSERSGPTEDNAASANILLL
jgi:hypothetical protein